MYRSHLHSGWSIHRLPPVTSSKPWLLILFVVLLLTALTALGGALMWFYLVTQ